MKLRNLLSIFFLASAGLSQAAEPAAQLFVAMPDSLVPSIEVNRRKDLIDLFHAGQKAQVDNKLGGTTAMTLLQDNGLTVDLSQQSQMALHLYPTDRGDTLIALVNTVYGPAADSRIRFFDSSWRELPASKHIRALSTADFFAFPDSLTNTQKKEILQTTGIYLVEYTFEPDGSLCARPSWEKYLDPETFKKIEPYLRKSITLRWNGNKLL